MGKGNGFGTSNGDWNNWIKACEIAWSAPQVIAMRTARMAVAGVNPTARDRAENTRMSDEKFEAFNESWVDIGTRMQRMQLDIAMRMWSESLRWWMQPWWLGRVKAFPSLDMSLLNFTPLVTAALNPVHRTVTANVLRLAGNKH